MSDEDDRWHFSTKDINNHECICPRSYCRKPFTKKHLQEALYLYCLRQDHDVDYEEDE